MTENRSTEALYSEDNTIEEETNQSQMSENSEDLEPIVIQTDEKEDILSKRDYLRYDDDEYDTKSSTDIKIVEDDCYYLFDLAANIDGEDYKLCKENGILDENHRVLFQRKSHIAFAEKLLKCIPSALGKQYHSRPWVIFHLLHSLTILKCPHKELDDAVLKYIDECQSIYGGYSQSKYGYPHLMVTYAAIMSIAIVGKEEGFQSIHRQSLYHLFLSLKHANGSFSVHENGESDIRGTYCVLSICKLLNMLTDEITANVSSYIHSLLSYEGGYAGTLGGEAHGGYNHCALACLHILNEDFYTPELDLWLTLCQSPFEGGFAGRTAKLVDGCYTYYQGAGMELVAQNRPQNHSLSCNEEGIKQYVMEITQDIDYYAHTVNGGLRDKPNYMTDPYHTCFVLSGISILDETGDAFDLDFNDPVYNISFQQIASMVNYFKDKPITSSL